MGRVEWGGVGWGGVRWVGCGELPMLKWMVLRVCGALPMRKTNGVNDLW